MLEIDVEIKRLPPRERILIVFDDGTPTRLDTCSTPLRLSDEQLPVRFLWKGDGELTQDRRTPGRLVNAEQREFDGLKEYQWNPFVRAKAKKKDDDSWRGNVSYGGVKGWFCVENETIEIEVDVRPSILTAHQLATMKMDLASIADELVMTSEGQTRSQVELSSARPRSWKHYLGQLEKYVRPILPLVRRLGRQPQTTNIRRFPQRIGVQRPDGRTEPILDCPENAFVAAAIAQWIDALRWCAAEARALNSVYDALHKRTLPPGLEKGADGLRRREWGEKRAAMEKDAITADVLARELAQALPWKDELHQAMSPVRLTPLIQRDPRYYAVFSAWCQIRRECVQLTARRAATETDILASIMYERWALLTICRLLLHLGWSPVDVDLLETDLHERLEKIGLGGRPIVFERDGDALHLYYEPELHKVAPNGTVPLDLYKEALSRSEFWGSESERFYSTSSYQTPDFVIDVAFADGSRTVIVGDAIYCPIADEDRPHFEDEELTWPSEVSRFRFEGKPKLQGKLQKVRDKYAAHCFLLSRKDGALRAAGHLGFVVFPGPPTSIEWISKVEPNVVALPLQPSAVSREFDCPEIDAAADRLRELLRAARDCAIKPYFPPTGQ